MLVRTYFTDAGPVYFNSILIHNFFSKIDDTVRNGLPLSFNENKRLAKEEAAHTLNEQAMVLVYEGENEVPKCKYIVNRKQTKIDLT